jgi:zinc protease
MKIILVLTFALLSFASMPAAAGMLDIKEVESASGLKAWLVEDDTVPVISLRFAFRGSGTTNDPVNKQGLTQLLSNTLDEGAGPLDSKAFQQTMADFSISLSFSASRDQFSGHVKTLSANKDKALELLTLALTAPRFDREAVDRMRLANLSRIKGDMTDPQWMASRLMNDTVYKNHPYAMNSGGTLTSLTKITANDLRAKVENELTRDRLIISAAGDISETELAILLDQVFGKLPATGPEVTTEAVTFPEKASAVLYKKDIPQTIIQMVMPGIDIKDPDYFAAEIMNFTFGGAGFGSRLMEVIREQRGLTYGIYSSLSGMKHADVMGISSSTKNESAKELIDLSFTEMQRMKDDSVSAQELRNAKTFLVGSTPLDLTSTDRISAYMLSFQAEGLPKNYLDLRAAGINSVTAEDVRRVAKRVLQPDKIITVMVGAPENIGSPAIVTTLPNVE